MATIEADHLCRVTKMITEKLKKMRLRGGYSSHPFEESYMEEQNTDVLIPAIQDTIQFQKKPLVVVRLPDGQPGVVLRWMCENLDLDTHAQVRRIQRTEVIADGLVYTRIETDGGPQVMPTLVLRAVPYWLATIDTRRMDKDDTRRAEILEYQRNAVDALYAWAQSIQTVPPAVVVASQQIVKPSAPPEGGNSRRVARISPANGGMDRMAARDAGMAG